MGDGELYESTLAPIGKTGRTGRNKISGLTAGAFRFYCRRAQVTPAHYAMASPIECVSADPVFWDCPTLDTDLHILNSLGEPLPLPDHIDPGAWVSDQEPALLRWFARETHKQYRQELRDNTFNSENDFSANFVFSFYVPEDCGDWCYASDVFVTVERHLGGDVRGNYGPFSVFRVDNIAETGFLDWVCGWHAEPLPHDADVEWPDLQRWNARFAVGFSSWPTGEVRDALASKEPAWCDTRKAWLARLQDVPFPVVLHPVGPCYC